MKFAISTLIFLSLFSSTKLIYAGITSEGSTVSAVYYQSTQFTPADENKLLDEIYNPKEATNKNSLPKEKGNVYTLKDIKTKEQEKIETGERGEIVGYASVCVLSDKYGLLDTKSVTKRNIPLWHPEAFGAARLLVVIYEKKGEPLMAKKLIEHPENEGSVVTSDLLGYINKLKLLKMINNDLEKSGGVLDELLVSNTTTLASLRKRITSDDSRLKPKEEFITRNNITAQINQLFAQRLDRNVIAERLNTECKGKRVIVNPEKFLNNVEDGTKVFDESTFNKENITPETINKLFKDSEAAEGEKKK